MASILLITDNSTISTPITNLRSAVPSHTFTTFATSTSTTSAQLDAAWAAGTYDAILLLRFTSSTTLATWVAGKWSAGVPLLVGSLAGATDGAAETLVQNMGFGTAITTRSNTATPNDSKNLTITAPNHNVLAGVTSPAAVLTAANFADISTGTVAGTSLGTTSVGGTSGSYMSAIEVGDALTSSTYVASGVAPARALWIGWLYALQSGYAAAGGTILTQAINWAVPPGVRMAATSTFGAVAPNTQPVVVEAKTATTIFSGATAYTFTNTPQPGDVYVALLDYQSSTATSVLSGGGASWTMYEGPSNGRTPRLVIAIGLSASNPNVVLTASGVYGGNTRIMLVRNAVGQNAQIINQGQTTDATATAFTSPSLAVKLGQFVAVQIGGPSSATIPSATAPSSGWTSGTALSSTYKTNQSWRSPSETAMTQHSVSATSTSAGRWYSMSLIMGGNPGDLPPQALMSSSSSLSAAASTITYPTQFGAAPMAATSSLTISGPDVGAAAIIQRAAATLPNGSTSASKAMGFTATATPNQVVVIALMTDRGSYDDAITGITGMGATWSSLGRYVSDTTSTSGMLVDIWVGTNPSGGGDATVTGGRTTTATSSNQAALIGYIVQADTTAVSVSGVASAEANTVYGPITGAKLGQAVIAFAAMYNVSPVLAPVTPSGWNPVYDFGTVDTFARAGVLTRIVNETSVTSHQVSATVNNGTGVARAIGQVTIGGVVPSTYSADVTMAATSSLAAAATVVALTATMDSTSSFTATGTTTTVTQASATLAATSTLTAAATARTPVAAAATLAATSSLTASGTSSDTAYGTVSMAATSALTAAGSVTPVQWAAVTMAASSTLATSAYVQQQTDVLMEATSDLTAVAYLRAFAAVTLIAMSQLLAEATVVTVGPQAIDPFDLHVAFDTPAARFVTFTPDAPRWVTMIPTAYVIGLAQTAQTYVANLRTT